MNARDDFLLSRRAGLGGSDIGAILGFSTFKTPVDVWMSKTGRDPGDVDTLPKRFGQYAEEFVAREYCAKTGQAVQRFTTMLRHPDAPILGNVDRLVIPAGQKRAAHMREIRTDRGLECKTASAFATMDRDEWGPEGTDEVPPSYLVQCATYMALTGCNLWDLAVLFGNQELRIYHLARDRDLEEEVIARATEWWDRYVVADVPPPPTCEADVKRLYPRDNGASITAGNDVVEWLRELAIVRAEGKELTIREDYYKTVIQSAMGEAATIKDAAGKVLATWKKARDSSVIDWEAVARALNPTSELIAANTTTKAGSRRFLTKEI